MTSASSPVTRQLIDEVGEQDRAAQVALLQALEAFEVVGEFVTVTPDSCFDSGPHIPEHIQHLPLDSCSRKDQPQHGVTHRIDGHIKFRIA